MFCIAVGDALELLECGAKSRRESSTKANLTSSRSHFVFSCVVTRIQKEEDGSMSTRIARLTLVDLAGSESVKSFDCEPIETLTEWKNINKSTTSFGRVIDALSALQKKGSKDVHVPYRDSKLTTLLQARPFSQASTWMSMLLCRNL